MAVLASSGRHIYRMPRRVPQTWGSSSCATVLRLLFNEQAGKAQERMFCGLLWFCIVRCLSVYVPCSPTVCWNGYRKWHSRSSRISSMITMKRMRQRSWRPCLLCATSCSLLIRRYECWGGYIWCKGLSLVYLFALVSFSMASILMGCWSLWMLDSWILYFLLGIGRCWRFWKCWTYG